MGASSSIRPSLSNEIYISSPPKNNELINFLYTKLVDLNYNIIKISETANQNQTENNKILNCYYLIICITPDIITSLQQIKLINNAWNHNKNIIYIITDDNYSPRNNREVKIIVQYDPWFLCTEKAAIIESLEGITHLLGNDGKKREA